MLADTFVDEGNGDGPPDPQNFRYSLVDNGMPVDIGVICCVFFGLSMGFHFLALLAGIFPRWWYVYWRQMVRPPDDHQHLCIADNLCIVAGRRLLLVEVA